MKRIVAVLGVLFVAACVPVPPTDPPPDPCVASPSVSTSLRPNALANSQGSPTAVGAGTIVQCLADESDSTYVDLDGGDPGDTVVLSFPEEPVGATAWSAAIVHVRAARPSGADATNLKIRVSDFSSGSSYLLATSISVTTSPANFSIPLTTVPTTAADIEDLVVSVFDTSGSGVDNFRVYRLELEITVVSDSVGAIPVGF